MQDLTWQISWLSVFIGAIAAYALGVVWYSPILFAKKWQKGLGAPAQSNRPFILPMLSQFLGSILLAWTLNIVAVQSIWVALLTAFTIAVGIKANGLFSGKTDYTIYVETGYIVAQAVIILTAFQILYK